MGVVQRVDQLHINPHVIGRFLDATFENICHPKLLGNLAQIVRRAFVLLRGSA